MSWAPKDNLECFRKTTNTFNTILTQSHKSCSLEALLGSCDFHIWLDLGARQYYFLKKTQIKIRVWQIFHIWLALGAMANCDKRPRPFTRSLLSYRPPPREREVSGIKKMSDQQQGEVFGAGKATSSSAFQLTSFLKKPIVVFRLAAVVSVGGCNRWWLSQKEFGLQRFYCFFFSISDLQYCE